jgi:hypothetical protein
MRGSVYELNRLHTRLPSGTRYKLTLPTPMLGDIWAEHGVPDRNILVRQMVLLHPQGETFDISMGLRGLFVALTKIAAQPDKDFGELVRQRRCNRGPSVAPAGKVLPLPLVGIGENPGVDVAAETVLADDTPIE